MRPSRRSTALGEAPAPAPPAPLKKFLGPATAQLTDEVVEAIKTRVRECVWRRFEALHPNTEICMHTNLWSIDPLYQEVVKLIDTHREGPGGQGDAGRMDDIEEGATLRVLKCRVTPSTQCPSHFRGRGVVSFRSLRPFPAQVRPPMPCRP